MAVTNVDASWSLWFPTGQLTMKGVQFCWIFMKKMLHGTIVKIKFFPVIFYVK